MVIGCSDWSVMVIVYILRKTRKKKSIDNHDNDMRVISDDSKSGRRGANSSAPTSVATFIRAQAPLDRSSTIFHGLPLYGEIYRALFAFSSPLFPLAFLPLSIPRCETRWLERNARSNETLRGDRKRVVKLLPRSIAKLIWVYGMRPADAHKRKKAEK